MESRPSKQQTIKQRSFKNKNLSSSPSGAAARRAKAVKVTTTAAGLEEEQHDDEASKAARPFKARLDKHDLRKPTTM